MSDLTPQAAILTAAFSSVPATPASATSAPPAPTAPTAPPTLAPGPPQGEITSAQAAQMIEWEKENLAKGRITPEEAAKRFDALGATPEQRAPDTRSDEVKLLDAQFAPAKESEYFIRYGEPGQPAPPMTKELQQFDTTARTWLSGAEFPRYLGNSLITSIERVAQATKAMTPEQLESYGMVEYEKLQRVYGDTLEEKLTSAGHMVEALDKKTPGLKNLLRSRGIGDNAMVASMLIQQSERYWARRR